MGLGRAQKSGWQGTLLVAPGHALYAGAASDSRLHRHHALQLTVALESPFEAQVGLAAPVDCEAMIIASNVQHRVHGHGHPVAIYYVDGASSEGRCWSAWLEAEDARVLTSEAPGLRNVLSAALGGPSAASLLSLRTRLAELLGDALPSPPEEDALVLRATALLEQRLGDPPSIPDLAGELGLRQRDLSARFRRETGLTVRRYVLWLRVQAAVTALAREHTLTQAAYAAGFADAAHLSRTFAQMFGVAPSDSIAASRIEVLGSG